jgi:hypothetical protein
MPSRLIAIALLLGAWLPWAALPTAAQVPADLPTVGATWRYTYRDQQFSSRPRGFTVQVAAREGSLVNEWLLVDGGETSTASIDPGAMRFYSRPLFDSTVLIELAPYWTRFDKRSRPDGYLGGLGLVVFWEIDPLSCLPERVTVPAGTFDAMRCEVKGSAPAFGQGTTGVGHVPTRFVYTAWYALAVKRYVRLRHQTWNRFGQPNGDEVVQLVSYQPGR